MTPWNVCQNPLADIALAKRVGHVMIMRLMFINFLGVSEASAWSAMFAYSLMTAKMLIMVWAWLQLVDLTFVVAADRY